MARSKKPAGTGGRMTARARLFKARQQAEKSRQQAQAVLSGFRPKKAERGSFVFLAKPSQAELRRAKKLRKRAPRYVRVEPGSTRKAFAVYVTARGNIKPVKEKRKNLRTMAQRLVKADRPELEEGTAEWEREVALREKIARLKSRLPAYSKPRRLDLFAAGRGTKRAAEKFYRGRRQPVYAQGSLPVLRSRGRGVVDFEKVSRTVGDAVWRVWQRSRQRDLDLLVEWSAVVEDGDGERHRLEGMSRFQARFNQEFERKQFWKFAMLVLYAAMAQQLSLREMVTTGSAGYVQRLPENRGEPDRRRWKNARGERWEKNEFSLVRLVEFSFDVSEMLADR